MKALASEVKVLDETDNMKLPKRLKRNPILEAIAEVRFLSSVPNDAVIGLVFSSVQDIFGKPENLPILQLPAALREADPNLKYQACYRFTKPGGVLLVSPHSVALSTQPYSDWGSASDVLSDVLNRLNKASLLERVERIGLRYVNFFEGLNILDHSTVALTVRGASISSQSVTIRAEHTEEQFKVVTQISNDATAPIGGAQKKGSVVDLDIIREAPSLRDSAPKAVMDVFTSANAVADVAFFRLLKDEFVATFGPEY